MLAATGDLDGALLDREERPREIPFSNDFGPLALIDRLGERAQLLQVVVVSVGEERNLPQLTRVHPSPPLWAQANVHD